MLPTPLHEKSPFGLLATIVLIIAILLSPQLPMAAPPMPIGGWLPVKVLLITVSVPAPLEIALPGLKAQPPRPQATKLVLPVKVLLITVSEPPLAMAPPALPVNVLSITANVPPGPTLSMAPPKPAEGSVPVLPAKVLFATLRALLLSMAPPNALTMVRFSMLRATP